MIDIEAKDLVTKKDLEVTKNQIVSQIVIWVAGLFLASGLIQHFLNK